MKKQLRSIASFWREQYGHYVFVTTVAFLAIAVMAYIAGRIFPDIPAYILDWFNESVENSGIVREDGSFSAVALFFNNLQAMALSVLYGFIPFLFLPALSLGVNSIILGMLAAHYSNNGISLLVYLAGILPHGIFELPALFLSLGAGLCLCKNINVYIRKNEKGIMKPLLLNILRVLCLLIPLLLAAAVVETYVTPLVMALVL